MKKFMMLFAFVIVGSLSNAQAYVSANANCWVNGGGQAVCEVCNHYYSRPIYCNMNMRGLTAYGAWMTAFQNGYVMPGQCINGFVRANNPYVDPLVDANVNFNCRF
ncbi:hypothetical protein ACRXCV_05195 [Halobacteriovorax sp. GFR7]|uniref:hypothetical protein n=1 Tax=unclassified Halobacteriovorax TaxID=2639665 RepID=UPI003D9934AD